MLFSGYKMMIKGANGLKQGGWTMIRNVMVFLDDNELEFMDGTIRCGYIISQDENGEESYHFDLLDDSGYLSVTELVDEITGILQVDREAVMVAA